MAVALPVSSPNPVLDEVDSAVFVRETKNIARDFCVYVYEKDVIMQDVEPEINNYVLLPPLPRELTRPLARDREHMQVGLQLRQQADMLRLTVQPKVRNTVLGMRVNWQAPLANLYGAYRTVVETLFGDVIDCNTIVVLLLFTYEFGKAVAKEMLGENICLLIEFVTRFIHEERVVKVAGRAATTIADWIATQGGWTRVFLEAGGAVGVGAMLSVPWKTVGVFVLGNLVLWRLAKAITT